MLPDDGGDEEDLAVAGQQQGPEEEAELRGLPHRQPQEAHRSAAEGQELCVGHRHTSGTEDEIICRRPRIQEVMTSAMRQNDCFERQKVNQGRTEH